MWNEVDLTASWRHINFLAPVVVRTDTHLPNPQLTAIGITADFALPWRLTLTGGYLVADLSRHPDLVHLPLFGVTMSFCLGKLTVADRNRFEKLIGYGTSPVRYRNRLMLDRPFGAREQWHVFVDDEIIFNLSAGNWNQNRFQAGGGARLGSRLFLDVYYLQRDARGGALEAHVLGTTVRVALTPKKH